MGMLPGEVLVQFEVGLDLTRRDESSVRRACHPVDPATDGPMTAPRPGQTDGRAVRGRGGNPAAR
jgi:hypothetical protein